MSNAAMFESSRTQSGIHPVNRPAAVMLLRSGSSFYLACSDCGQTIARKLPDADGVRSQAERINSHRVECMGPRRWWMRRMIRLFAVS